MSLFELVEAQGEARRGIAPATAAELDVCDRFFTAALAGFEVAQRANVDAQQERVRGELMRRLTNAYLAVTAPKTADERCAAASRQIELLLAAPTARVELLDPDPGPVDADAPVLTAHLPGGGRIVVIGAPGRVWSEGDEAILQQLAVLVHSPIVEARLLELTARLERVGALLGEEADPQAIVDRMLADGLDQTGAVYGAILAPDAHAEPDSPIAMAARIGTPLFLSDHASIVAWADRHGLSVPEAFGQAWAAVPLPDGGALGMRFEQPQAFDPAQRSFLTQVGQRLAAALERGRAFVAEREARHQAESAAARVSQLHQLAVDLSEATTRRAVAASLLDHTMRTVGAIGGLVAVATDDRDDFAVLAAVGAGGRRTSDGIDDLAGLARLLTASAPRPDPFAASTLPAEASAALRALGAQTVAMYTLSAAPRGSGRLVVWWSELEAPPFDREQLAAARAMAGPALRRAGRYDLEHDISITLQRSLLTVADVEIPGIDWSARYQSGSRGVAGGDWYDVIALDGGRVGVAIGDIVGKGVDAAAAMGQVRSATRALARHVDDPAKLLEALGDFASSTGPGLYSSAAFFVIDPVSGEVEHAVAGHPPPVVRSARRGTFSVETGRGALLGIEGRRATATLQLDAGDLLVLYTDGLVERRRRPLDEGLARLQATVATGSIEPARLCQQVIDACDGASDDVAIVVVKLLGP